MGCANTKKSKNDEGEVEGVDETNKDNNKNSKKSKNEKKTKVEKNKEDKKKGNDSKKNKVNDVNKEATIPEEKENNEPTKNVSNGKSGPNSAKVRPLTPTPPKISQTNENIPKPVAFDVNLDAQTKTDDESAENVVKDGGYRLRLPRKLPKLTSHKGSSVNIGIDQPPITSEEIQEKQRKAEEKRQEILEEKKQKARKFVEKFGNNGTEEENSSNQIDNNVNGENSSDQNLINKGMNGLDSGLGLDGYGLEEETKVISNDDTNITNKTTEVI